MPAAHRLRKVLVAALLLTSLTIVSSPNASAAVGDIDSALNLNGSNQYAEVTDPGTSPFDSTGTITIETWVYPTSTCSGSQVVLVKEVSYMMYCYLGKWLYAYSGNGLSWNGAYTSIPVEANAWHHIAYTHSASSTNLKVYYDGVNIETLTSSMPTTMTPNNGAIRIGQSAGASFFQGKIDDVRIYNSQRTDVQIQNDMKTWGPNNDSDLIAYYDFNDESGSTLTNADATPAANSTMTLYGSPGYSNVESTSVINGDQVITFPRSYLTTNGGWKIPSHVSTLKSLVVAGGGAGGSRAGAGGGAGGYVYDAALSVTPNSVQSITVGMGGMGFLSTKGNNGTNSQLGSLRTALGGGAGGTDNGADNSTHYGSSGGSGGGSAGGFSSTVLAGASSTQSSTYGYGLGSNGGSGEGTGNWSGGGGGGANISTGTGGNGTASSNGGKGGDGITDPIGGTSICYATGGGGGSANTTGAGGNCGGAASVNNNAGGPVSSTTWPGIATANTGSGGGGGSWSGMSDPIGGFGASGVVVLRYPLNMSVSISYSGGASATYRTVGTITATGTLAGKVTFYERGKAIPGCKSVAMNGSFVATCSWRPSTHGATVITATAKPSNTYVSNGSATTNISVVKRTNNR